MFTNKSSTLVKIEEGRIKFLNVQHFQSFFLQKHNKIAPVVKDELLCLKNARNQISMFFT